MVVFTAKINVTGETFVGSARENVEEHWAQLIALAEDGGSGELLDRVREHGANSIQVETWDYAESPSESRELMREACDHFSAKMIKTGRVKPARVIADKTQEKDDLSTQAQLILSQNQAKAEAEKKIQALQAKAKLSQTEHGPVVSVDIEAYRAKQSSMGEKTKSEPVSLRHTESTEIADDMKSVMVRIELQRKMNQAKNSPTKKRSTHTKKVSSIKNLKVTEQKTLNQQEVVKKLKLPDGRVSSSVKEKRIKEAIAQEKMEREAIRSAKVAEEANDMAALLAKLDERTREKGKLMRRR
ncbi:MAG: colicin import membrane protein [Oleiphilaceae bacterium]|jgi:colicin import membrane protein